MNNSKPNELLVNNFKIPNWSGRPPPGLHLDVLKEGKLIQVPIDSELHFGASTRMYIIRERPNPLYSIPGNLSDPNSQSLDGNGAIGPENRSGIGHTSATNSLELRYSQLPQSEVELDNLTEFNTAHNRRISSMVDVASNPTVLAHKKRRRPPQSVHFSDADEVINPEDVDPSIGRFRNLIQETFIPNKVILNITFTVEIYIYI
ncbi:unnamed protein product [Trichobilharzia regenti]|nr:unnamed protein product [Trichobilharzia regenti]